MDEQDVLPFKLTLWDLVLVGTAVAFFFSTFFTWQDFGCKPAKVNTEVCRSATAWLGDGWWAGIIAALAAMGLFIVAIIESAGLFGETEMPLPSLKLSLGGVAVGAGLLRFVFAILDRPDWGAWVGLVLIGLVGAALALEHREETDNAWRPAWLEALTPGHGQT